LTEEQTVWAKHAKSRNRKANIKNSSDGSNCEEGRNTIEGAAEDESTKLSEEIKSQSYESGIENKDYIASLYNLLDYITMI